MAITRTVYTAGTANICYTLDQQGEWAVGAGSADFGTGAIGANGFPFTPESLIIQSVDFSHEVPKETITAFGTTAFKRIPNEAESGEIELEVYPGLGIGGGGAYGLQGLAACALAQNPNYVNVYTTAGNLAWALLSSFEFEASVGDVPTMSMTFMGVPEGSAVTTTTPSSSLSTLQNVGTTATITAGLRGNYGNPIGTNLGIGNASTSMMNIVFPQSLSFSWDAGVETIARLGEKIVNSVAFGTPPGEASIDCEGLQDPGSVQWFYLYGSHYGGNASKNEWVGATTTGMWLAPSQDLSIGVFFQDDAGDISSKSVSIAVGELFGTYSTTTEGTALGVTIVG